jgi:hypothetical protein
VVRLVEGDPINVVARRDDSRLVARFVLHINKQG